MSGPSAAFDLIAVGRISVDLYAQQAHASFAQDQTFVKSIGGSPTNVAVAAARLGLRSALASGVGQDELGAYALTRLAWFGVHADFVRRVAGVPTPLVLASRNPPEEPAILFFRDPHAPDTRLQALDLARDQVQAAGLLWVSGSALAVDPTAEAMRTWMAWRGRVGVALDLDYRPTLWDSVEQARAHAQQAIGLSSIVIGNRAECQMALGIDDPDGAADALLGLGVQVAVIKLGAQGSVMATAQARVRLPSMPVEVVCGLGAGDAFGGALAHAILHGMDMPSCLRQANAAGALVAGRPTCADDMPTLAELEEFMADWDPRPGGGSDDD